MAKGRYMSKKRRKRRFGLAIFVMLLLAALVCVYFYMFAPIRAERLASVAAKMFGNASIPRCTYQHDGFSVENGRVHYEDDTYIALTGIDVSSHQGEIDWIAVAGDGISYAIIQAGYRGYEEGEMSEDPMYRTNLQGARSVGLPCGVYFFSQAISAEEAAEEAAFLLEILDGTELQLPVFYDWEPVSAENGRANSLDSAEITACAKAFCERVEAGGYEAAVYFNLSQIYKQVRLEQLLDYPLWMAQYQNISDCIYHYTWWQYTDVGSVAGINTIVDMNLWFIEKEQTLE